MIEYDSLNGRPQVHLLDEKTVRKTAMTNNRDLMRGVEGMCKHLMAHPDPTIVPIYSFGVDETVGAVHHYHYDMLRLGMLNDDEKRLVDHIAYPADYNRGIIEQGRKDYPALAAFMDEIIRLGRYGDIHCGNFLKDEEENYRVIDLEGFMHYPLTNAANNWFRI